MQNILQQIYNKNGSSNNHSHNNSNSNARENYVNDLTRKRKFFSTELSEIEENNNIGHSKESSQLIENLNYSEKKNKLHSNVSVGEKDMNVCNAENLNTAYFGSIPKVLNTNRLSRKIYEIKQNGNRNTRQVNKSSDFPRVAVQEINAHILPKNIDIYSMFKIKDVFNMVKLAKPPFKH
jgi:hypothetical protein